MVGYILVPCIALAALFAGRMLTVSGMQWYQSITLPSFTPPKWVFGIVWQTLYVFAAISALRVWYYFPRDVRFYVIISLFIMSVLLNVLWSYLFFVRHATGWAFIETILICGIMALLIILLYPQDPIAALLLAPYLMWVVFASYLNYRIWVLN